MVNDNKNCGWSIQGQSVPCVSRAPIWNNITNVREDICAQRIDEMQSALPGCYSTNNFFRWCETQDEYSNLMTEPGQFYKPYRNACRIDTESVLRNADLTNKGELYQLFTKPYPTVPYMGAGTASLNQKDLESRIQQGFTTTNYKACEPTSGVTINRFQCLPNFGNPYVDFPDGRSKLIEPWVRGGENTRDYVRRVDYQNYCLNKANNNIINRTR